MIVKKDTISRILHWTFAYFIFVMLGLGFYIANTEFNLGLYGWHKSLGVIFSLLIGVRLFWLMKHPWQGASVLNKNEMMARSLVHRLLIFMLIAMPIAGLLSSAYSGWSVHLFDIIIVPKNLNLAGEVESYNETIYQAAKFSHRILAYLFSGLIILHIGAVLKHHFINKDNTLIKMLKDIF